MVYNLQIFEKAVFKVPSTTKLTAAVLAAGAFTGLLIKISVPELARYELWFFLPALFLGLGELIYRFTPEFPRNWSYLISLFNASVFGLVFTPLLVAESTVSSSLLTPLLMVLLTLNFGIFIVAAGNHSIFRVLSLSYVSPAAVLALFYLSADLSLVQPVLYLTGLGGVLLGVYYAHEYLFSSNIQNFSGAELVSGLIQERRENLDLGHRVNTMSYTLEIENMEGKCNVGAPWIHPGPLRLFGAADISSRTIEEFDSGFFFHLPSTHKEDPVETSAVDKILESYGSPELNSQASRLVEKEFGSFTLYGRKIGDKRIVFMKSAEFDDYEKQIISEVIDEERTLVVDLHPHKEHSDHGILHLDSAEAERFRRELQQFLTEIDNLETYEYSAGFEDRDCGKRFFSLVEEVDGQKTVLLGCDENGICETVEKFSEDQEQKYDHVLSFSTDTHEDIIDLTLGKEMDEESMREALEEAENSLSGASIGLTSTNLNDVRVFGSDYVNIMSTVNIMVRMFALSILVLLVTISVTAAF